MLVELLADLLSDLLLDLLESAADLADLAEVLELLALSAAIAVSALKHNGSHIAVAITQTRTVLNARYTARRNVRSNAGTARRNARSNAGTHSAAGTPRLTVRHIASMHLPAARTMRSIAPPMHARTFSIIVQILFIVST